MNVRYAVSRTLAAAILGSGLYIGGLPWWAAASAGGAALLFFLMAPRSGRYVVESEGGATPLHRDERARAIRDKAARNALVVTVLAVAGLVVAYGRTVGGRVPVATLGAVLGAAAVTYGASDVFLRRRP